MAHGIYPDYSTGSDYGPCEDCEHTDCAALRAKLPEHCARCGEEMRSGNPFFYEDGKPVHATHVWEEVGV